MKRLVVIIGPTAIGKTALSVDLALDLGCEIISADSRQFYKDMAIGTAKPTKSEMKGVPHHFVDFISVTERYTAGQFEADVLKKLEQLFEKNNTVIMVGGSGLYIDAVCKGLDDIPADAKVRERLNSELKTEGVEVLQERLKKVDSQVYTEIDIKNPQRVVRALEVFEITGKPYSYFRKKAPKKRNFEIIKIGLNTEREKLYERINKRVDKMMEEGLLKEVIDLLPYRTYNALNTVGYRELFSHLDEKITLEEATELIKKNTRNFAKRQLTWFRKDKITQWFEPNEQKEIKYWLESGRKTK